MIKLYSSIIITCFIISCGLKKSTKQLSQNDSLIFTDSTNKYVDSVQYTNINSSDTPYINLLEYSQYVLNSIKHRDINKLASYVHPNEGVRLSPYGYIDLKNDRKLPPDELIDRYNYDNIYLWGYFDGTGYGIKMSLKEYFNRFIYDIDFENQSTASHNEFKCAGNSQNNLLDVYKDQEFIEYYYKGTKKMENMDWKVLRLVYKKEKGIYYLVGIVHDEWTI